MTDPTSPVSPVRVAPAKVSDPIVFKAQTDGPEQVARPCSGRHRELWLSGYIVLSCRKCVIEGLVVS